VPGKVLLSIVGVALIGVAAFGATEVLAPGDSAEGAPDVTKLSPPVIRESFTLVPCAGKPSERTTVDEEGCRERKLMKADKRIERLTASIFKRLHKPHLQRQFLAGARAWLAYRHLDCTGLTAVFADSTFGPLDELNCELERSESRLKDLGEFPYGT
jgi:uncharacterized protein YecT (DUF1311 family)